MIYNQLVTAVMVVEGVQDVIIDLYRGTQFAHGRQNLTPDPPDTRPRLDVLDVKLRGAPIALDVTVIVERIGDALNVDKATELADTTTDLRVRIGNFLAALTGALTIGGLDTALTDTARYRVDRVTYTAEFVDEGLRVLAPDVEIQVGDDQQLWLRSVIVREPDEGA